MSTICLWHFYKQQNNKRCAIKLIIFMLVLLIGAMRTSYSQDTSIDSSRRFLDFFDLTRNLNRTLKITVSLMSNTSGPYIESVQLPAPNGIIQLNSQIEFQKNCVFIIHGFLSSSRALWVSELGLAYKQRKDVNIFVVDWRSGSVAFRYSTSVKKSRPVGGLLSNFIKHLISTKNLNPKSIHIIGHNLGAHIAGFVGKNVPNIGRITGLDPVRPLFMNRKEILKKGDAMNVDVIHTNGFYLGIGIAESIGDVDYFFNGGRFQPGCPTVKDASDYFSIFNIFKSITSGVFRLVSDYLHKVGCAHHRSVEYFIESIKNPNCSFIGHRQPSVSQTDTNNVNGDISVLGLSTFEHPARGDFFVETNSKEPYCINRK